MKILLLTLALLASALTRADDAPFRPPSASAAGAVQKLDLRRDKPVPVEVAGMKFRLLHPSLSETVK